jgi:hypothetical protein
MPCYRCGVRQTDPGRGQSPWKRGVRQDSQILICPGCQATHDWMTDLDRCSVCSSLHLVRRLGEVECRDCGAIVPPAGGPAADDPSWLSDPRVTDAPTAAGHGPGRTEETAPGLSEEVARALDRVLSQSVVSQSIQQAGRGDSGPPGARTAGPGGERHHAGSVSPGAVTG